MELLPVLRDELAALRAARCGPGGAVPPQDEHVFLNAGGNPRDKDNARCRVMNPAKRRADELLAEREQRQLPTGLTPHKLRHTFASILAALNEPMPYVMAQLGHSDPGFTMRVYAHSMRRGDEEREQLRALVAGGVHGLDDRHDLAGVDPLEAVGHHH